MQLLLIDDHLHLVPETDEESAGETVILIEMTDDALKRSIPIYFSHNPKDEPRVEASHLVFVLKTDGVERGP